MSPTIKKNAAAGYRPVKIGLLKRASLLELKAGETNEKGTISDYFVYKMP